MEITVELSDLECAFIVIEFKKNGAVVDMYAARELGDEWIIHPAYLEYDYPEVKEEERVSGDLYNLLVKLLEDK